MKLRFTIKNLLIVTTIVALFTGLFAPELRAWNRNSFLLFTAIGVVTAIVLVSFTPVWSVLFWLRRRSRRGLGIKSADYAVVFIAFFLSLGLIAGIFAATMMIVGK